MVSLPKTPSRLRCKDLAFWRCLAAVVACRPARDRRRRRDGHCADGLSFLQGPHGRQDGTGRENLALRHQLAVLQRSVKRPELRKRDRAFWVWLSRLWPDWRSALVVVQPATVVKWQRQGFKLYWRRKSRRKAGRPQVDRKIRDLIRRISRENPTWGAPRILSELLLLGHKVAESTIDKYMVRQTLRRRILPHQPVCGRTCCLRRGVAGSASGTP